MTIDLMTAAIHHLAVFVLLGLLVAQWVLLQPGSPAAGLPQGGRAPSGGSERSERGGPPAAGPPQGGRAPSGGSERSERGGLDPGALRRVSRVDAAYGGAAAVVLAVGFARVFFGMKGSSYYLGNPMFWTKLGLFIAIGLVSIVPTLRFMAWRRAHRQQGTLPDRAAVHATRRLVGLQLGGFAFLPVIAAALARGVGL